ncbi:MAG: hemerythrin domain-containing protein, partial [Nanoarchaeota archaeon]|nr:hemerythrin domain-containing protein [Nanoarchaeota archaeon]
METPIGVLKEEHEIIKEGLDVLELLSKTDAKKIQVSDVEGILGFFKEFADDCHHAKEEKMLFP